MYVNTKVSTNGQFRAPDMDGRGGGGGGGVGHRPMTNRWTQPQVGATDDYDDWKRKVNGKGLEQCMS